MGYICLKEKEKERKKKKMRSAHSDGPPGMIRSKHLSRISTLSGMYPRGKGNGEGVSQGHGHGGRGCRSGDSKGFFFGFGNGRGKDDGVRSVAGDGQRCGYGMRGHGHDRDVGR